MSTTGGPHPDTGAVRASIAAVSATTCGMLAPFLTSALAPLLRDDAIVTPARLGLAVAVYFAVSAVIAPLGGRLADRIGSVLVMRVSLVLAAVSLSVVAAAVRSWPGLTLALGLAGAANGAIQPSANRYLTRLIPPARQGLAFGIKQAAIPAAILLGGVGVPTAAYLTGWRGIYVAGAALAIAVALAIRRRSPAPHVARAPGAGTAGDPAVRAAPNPFPRHALLIFASGWALASAGANALGSFFVLGAVDAGFLTATAGLLAVLGSVSSIGVRIGVGFVADRWKGRGFGAVAAMSAVGAAGVGLLATGTTWAFVTAAVIGYGVGWGWAGLFNYAVVRSEPTRPGRTTGITQAGAGAGACAGPLAFGTLVSLTGYSLAWLAAGATLLAASGVIVVGRALLPASTLPTSGKVQASQT